MNKNGQTATEFLLKYGWAIFVIGVTIAALAYFGVLDPHQYDSSQTTNEQNEQLRLSNICDNTCKFHNLTFSEWKRSGIGEETCLCYANNKTIRVY